MAATLRVPIARAPMITTPTNLKSLRVVLTGGSSGLGRATVERFLVEGHRVLFTFFLNESAANEIVERFGHDRAQAVFLDQGDPASIASFRKSAIIWLAGEKIDVLINNAALGSSTVRDYCESPLAGKGHLDLESDLDSLQDQAMKFDEALLRVNALGPLWVTRFLFPLMNLHPLNNSHHNHQNENNEHCTKPCADEASSKDFKEFELLDRLCAATLSSSIYHRAMMNTPPNESIAHAFESAEERFASRAPSLSTSAPATLSSTSDNHDFMPFTSSSSIRTSTGTSNLTSTGMPDTVASASTKEHSANENNKPQIHSCSVRDQNVEWPQAFPCTPSRNSNKRSVIIFISSVGGGSSSVFPEYLAADLMSKAAVAYLSKHIASLNVHSSLDIIGISPGACDSYMFQASTLTKMEGRMTNFVRNMPKSRLIRPSEIAGILLFLATSPESTLFHGAILDASMGLAVRPGLQTEYPHS